MTSRDTRRNDQGFSIAELLVAIVVGFLVLGAAYLIMETGAKSFRDIENSTIQGRAAADSLEQMAKPMREETGLSGTVGGVPTDYDVQFLADGDDDGSLEQYHFFVNAGSTVLQETKTELQSGVATTTTVTNMLRNRLEGVPLFTYYSAPGSSLTGTATATARFVRMKVIVQRQTTPLPPEYTRELDVFLRNAPSGE